MFGFKRTRKKPPRNAWQFASSTLDILYLIADVGTPLNVEKALSIVDIRQLESVSKCQEKILYLQSKLILLLNTADVPKQNNIRFKIGEWLMKNV